LIDYKKEFQRFLQEQKKLSPGTQAAYLGDVSYFVAFIKQQGMQDLAQAGSGELNAFVRWLGGQEKSPATVNRAIASVRCFFSALQSYGIVQQNPAQWLTGQRISRRSPLKELSESEFRSILQAAGSTTPVGARDCAILFLFRELGARTNDLLQADLADADPDRGCFVCAKSSRMLSADAAASLQNYLLLRPKLQKNPEESALFLNQYGHRMSRQGVWKKFKKYAEQAGLPEWAAPRMLR